jgi:sialate O-acetylesterase
MIAPLLPLTVKGSIWYQGESNVSRAQQYKTIFPTMIRNWREAFHNPEMPFYFVQIAPYKYNKTNPTADMTPCAELWEAQLETLRTVPNTGMAVTMDIGNVDNIHPTNKQEVGRRLSLWALGTVYGKNVPSISGPLPASSTINGNAITVTFKHADAGLKTKDGGPVKGFEIAGADQRWKSAAVRLDGDKVTISSPDIAAPVAVRYAWLDVPDCNLCNGADLPASPFRTDDWPAVAAAKK